MGVTDYLYRWYDPPNARWPSRDPIGEQGGSNLYGFVGNESIRKIDVNGMSAYIQYQNANNPKLSYTSDSFSLGECGAFSWVISWKVGTNADVAGGAIPQKIKMKVSITHPPKIRVSENNYTEAWRVEGGTKNVGLSYPKELIQGDYKEFYPSAKDTWFYGRNYGKEPAFEGTEGETQIEGWAQYYTPVSLNDYLKTFPQVLPENHMPSTRGAFNLPGAKASNELYRKVVVTWCCKDGATADERATKVKEVVPTAYNLDREPLY
jgi:hypothetical protein